MPFVGAAAVLEPEHATVGAALMLGTPKKVPLLQTIFHVVVCMSTRSYGGVVMVGVAGHDGCLGMSLLCTASSEFCS